VRVPVLTEKRPDLWQAFSRIDPEFSNLDPPPLTLTTSKAPEPLPTNALAEIPISAARG